MIRPDDEIEGLTGRIIRCAIEVHRVLGPGLLVYSAQVITYLKLTGCPAGVLMNFNQVLLKNGLRRLDHPDRYARKKKD